MTYDRFERVEEHQEWLSQAPGDDDHERDDEQRNLLAEVTNNEFYI